MCESLISARDSRRLVKFEIAGAIFNCLASTLLHFLYELSGEELAAALFSAVNESVWEHIKIFTLPYVVWAFLELFCLKLPFRHFAASKVFGLYFLLISIPVLFYTYTGIVGRNILIVDILSGYILTALAYVVSYCLITKAPFIERYFKLTVILFAVYCVMIAFFTFSPPKIFLFRDPLTGTFGL